MKYHVTMSRCLGSVLLALWLPVCKGLADDAVPRVHLVTFGVGNGIWARYGHNGLLVGSPEDDSASFYDFGHSRVRGIKLLVEYLRGDCPFYLSHRDWAKAMRRNRRPDRSVDIQLLDLTKREAEQIVARLEEGTEPENREYVYDQLYDNCSTRIRDLLDDVTDGALRRTGDRPTGCTYRDYTLSHTAGSLPIQLALDLIAGPHHDRVVRSWDHLFLPENLSRAVQFAIREEGGVRRPLATAPQRFFERRGRPAMRGSPYFARWVLLLVSLAVALLFVLVPCNTLWVRVTGCLQVLVSVGMGFVGAVLALLVGFSVVPDFAWNQNMLIFAPSDILLLVPGMRAIVTGTHQSFPLAQLYVGARLAVLAILAMAKLAGWVEFQDNMAFLAAAAMLMFGFLLRGRRRSPSICG